ncbi:MAG: hypothetical protein RRA35_09920, partial [Desulfomonilia bacterium]|nr:hypothetical protein [Desulfomonilia bacterium]
MLPSLIPSLKLIQGGFHLELARTGEDGSTPRTRFPFVLISESGTFTRIIRARIVSDSTAVARQAFLLLSRDDYPDRAEAHAAATNAQVDASWQRAWEHRDPSSVVFASQLTPDGTLLPLKSLFYCREQEIFFHPPCPECGLDLALCTDDELLVSEGLAPYTASLKRYLFCPECASAKGSAVFYAARPGATEPEQVRNAADLIRGFGSLTSE